VHAAQFCAIDLAVNVLTIHHLAGGELPHDGFMRLSIRTDEREEAPIELRPGQSVLVGRQPSLGEVDVGALGTEDVREVVASSPSVSSNHVLVSHTDAVLRVVDLESRNGSWLELPAHAPVEVAAVPHLRIHLAPARPGAADHDSPLDADWTNEAEFTTAVAHAVQAWLQRRGIPARTRVERRRATPAMEDSLGRVPLDADYDLLVEAVHTMDARWLSTLRRVTRYVERQSSRLRAEQQLGAAGLIVASKAMKRAVHQVIEAAERPGAALLILGPSGSGKEGLARCYHARTRPRGPFVSRNCAQFQFGKDLVLSELFGAERGSFTGATRTTTGAVELANHGTLFLDELAELPLDVQSVLLRFLDRGEFTKTGSGVLQTSDVRVVGATNRDLRAACLEGSFRRDLWFRLAAEVVEVPPLSERFEDITAYLAARTRGPDRPLLDAFDPAALDVLRAHGWEGNFRELINFVNRLPDVERIDADTCRRVLGAGALRVAERATAVARPQELGEEAAFTELLLRAAAAFEEDHAGQSPRLWKDVKELVEDYVKPLLFAGLSGSLGAHHRHDLDLRAASERVAADRGTATKQLERFLERFTSSTRHSDGER
jgi:DNA-binding NtrC family response regulator